MILTHWVVEIPGDADPSGVPSPQNPLYGLCRGEKNTFLLPLCYILSHELPIGVIYALLTHGVFSKEGLLYFADSSSPPFPSTNY